MAQRDPYSSIEEQEEEFFLYEDPPDKTVGSNLLEVRKAENAIDIAEGSAVSNVTPPYLEGKRVVEDDYAIDPKGADEGYAAGKYNFVENAFNEATVGALTQYDSYVTSNLMQGKEDMRKIQEKPYGPEAATELSHKGKVEESPFVYASTMVSDMLDSAGVWDLLVDGTGLILLPDYLKDISDLTTQEGFFGVPDAPEKLKQMVAHYQTLTPEEQIAIFPSIQEEVMNAAEGNVLKSAIILMSFLDPTVEEEVDFNSLLGKIDWGLIAAPVITSLWKLGKTALLGHRVKSLMSKRQLAKVDNAVLSDESETLADAIGRNRTEAAADAYPFNVNNLLPGSVDDMAGATAEQAEDVRRAQAAVREPLEPIFQDDFLKVRLLTDEEQANFIKATEQSVLKYAQTKFEQQGYLIEKAERSGVSADGFQVKITLRDSTTGEAQEAFTPTFHFTKDGIMQDSGKVPQASWLGVNLGSPQIWLESALKAGLIEDATLIDFQKFKIAKQLNAAQITLWKGVSKKSQKRIDKVLHAGANYTPQGSKIETGRIFSYRDLREGVDVGDGNFIKLNHEEATKYFQAREIFDANYILLNRVQRSSLKANGFWEGKLGESAIIGRPFFTTDDIPNRYRGVGNSTVWDETAGKAVKLDGDALQKKYDEGFILTELHDSSYINKGKNQYTYALVHEGDVKDLRANVIRYQRGYVPRIYKDTPYVVEKSVGVFQNGRRLATPRTEVVRRFTGRKEAQEWIETLEESERGLYTPRHMNEIDPSIHASLVTQEAGGLFIDPRGKHLLMGLHNDKAPIQSARDALDRQLSFISDRLPSSEFRVALEERWKASAKAAGIDAEHVDRYGLASTLEGVGDTQVKNALEASRRWVHDQFLIPTPSERAWQQKMVSWADWAEGKQGMEWMRSHILLPAATKDPTSYARGVAFHTMLGFLNPAQLFVQAMGFSVAASLDGLHKMPVRFSQYMAMRTAFDAHPEMINGLSHTFFKIGGFKNADEMASLVHDFQKSGLMESVRSNADLNAMKIGYHFDSHLMGRVANANLALYREGESFTRGYSFLVARDEWLKANNLSRSHRLDDKQLIEVLELTTDRMFNLTRANRARWQSGLISIPTQFAQVSAKFVEAMAPQAFGGRKGRGAFTAKEKFKIGAGQAVLFGSAGIPFADWAISNVAEWLGYGPEDLTEETKSFVRNGVFSMAAEYATGEGFEVGRRGAFASYFEELAREIGNDRPSFARLAAGAAGSVGIRSYDAAAVILPMVFNPDLEMTWAEYTEATLAVTDTVTTFSNAHKAYLWWKHQEVQNQYGDTISLREMDNFNAIWVGKALGFESETIDDVYNAAEFARKHTEAKTELKKALKKISISYINKVGHEGLTEQHMTNMQLRWNMLLRFYPEQLRVEAEKEAWDDLWSGVDKESDSFAKAWRKYWDYGSSNIGNPVTGSSIMFNKNLISEGDE
jgi:hypothetical protein